MVSNGWINSIVVVLLLIFFTAAFLCGFDNDNRL